MSKHGQTVHTHKVYGEAAVYFDEGWYNKTDILEVLDMFKLQEKRNKELMLSLEKANEKI